VEHWLLSAGTSDVAKLRGYLRVKTWRQCNTPRSRAHAIGVLAKLPARAYRESSRAVAVHGGRVAREFGVSAARQLRQLCWLWVRHGVHPEAYYYYQLYLPGQLRRAPGFLQEGEASELYRMLSVRVAPAEAELLADKPRFERWLAERGFPTLRTLVEFVGGEVLRSSTPDRTLPRRDLFSKMSDSQAGAGAQRWRYDGEGWVGEDGRRRGERELVAELAGLSRSRGVLLQEQVRNHPALAPLAPAALSTVRVVTLRDVGGAVRIVFAVCKIPTGAAATDHMAFGGVAAPVDLATGRLGRGIRKDEGKFITPSERHPDTGAVIAGFQLPDWERAKQLVLHAHEALDRIACVGWDVALLDEGPIIVEGNDNPGSASSQMPTGVALAETPIVPALVAHLRAAFAGASPSVPSRAGPRAAEPVGSPT
jgi:hypothetical protein